MGLWRKGDVAAILWYLACSGRGNVRQGSAIRIGELMGLGWNVDMAARRGCHECSGRGNETGHYVKSNVSCPSRYLDGYIAAPWVFTNSENIDVLPHMNSRFRF